MKTLLLCLEIFGARLADVSIGSVRTIFLVKQKNILASIFAFIEIVIWFLVARETLTQENIDIFVVLSYAGGYAVGTYVGGLINKFFVKGSFTAFVITNKTDIDLKPILKDTGYGVSTIEMQDNKLLYIIEFDKKQLKNRLNSRLKASLSQVNFAGEIDGKHTQSKEKHHEKFSNRQSVSAKCHAPEI